MNTEFFSHYRNHLVPHEYIELLKNVDLSVANGTINIYLFKKKEIVFFNSTELLAEEGESPFKKPRYARFSQFMEEKKAQQKRYKNYMRGVDIEKFYAEQFYRHGLNLAEVHDFFTIGSTEGAMLVINLHDGKVWLLYFDGYILLLSESLTSLLKNAQCCPFQIGKDA